MSNQFILAKRYQVIEAAGAGRYSVVYKAYDLQQCRLVALKVLTHPYGSEFSLREIKLHSELTELKQVLPTLGICEMLNWFVDSGVYVMVLVYYATTLLASIESQHGLPIIQIVKIAQRLLTTLKEMHDTEVTHMDIKPDNILLHNNVSSDARLNDFGLADIHNNVLNRSGPCLTTACPELLVQPLGVLDCKAVDMWSLGITLLHMYLGQPLFTGTTPSEQLCQIRSLLGELPASAEAVHAQVAHRHCNFSSLRTILRQRIGEQAKYSITKVYVSSLSQVHHLFEDLIEGTLQMNPAKRLTADQAVQLPLFSYIRIINEA